jgi:hypothetical protein
MIYIFGIQSLLGNAHNHKIVVFSIIPQHSSPDTDGQITEVSR